MSGNSPALKSDRTARATALLDAVRRLPAGCDVAALVGELRNVLNCHEALLEEHCVETEAEMACGVGVAPVGLLLAGVGDVCEAVVFVAAG